VVTGAPKSTRVAVRRGVAASAVSRRDRNAGCSGILASTPPSKEAQTYNNLSVDSSLQHARCVLLLLAGLALLHFRRLARRRQADGYVCDLQHCEGRKDAEKRWYGVGDNGLEFVRIERQDDDGMHVGV
jgi:hypothetical protein